MSLFKHNDFLFKLTTPDYEIPVFGFKVGELRLVNSLDVDENSIPFTELTTYLGNMDIKICTFRGEESINVVRLLQDVDFKFVSTYNKVICTKEDFKEIPNTTNFNIDLARELDYEDILEIEKTVLDYSTFSIDSLIEVDKASIRNAIRVKSHFKKKNHRIYVTRKDGKIVGFIQFLVDIDNKKADTLNLGIHPDYQSMGIGKSLFSDTISGIFKEGCELVTSDFSTQNIGSGRLHFLCNFKLEAQEIHLRYYIKSKK